MIVSGPLVIVHDQSIHPSPSPWSPNDPPRLSYWPPIRLYRLPRLRAHPGSRLAERQSQPLPQSHVRQSPSLRIATTLEPLRGNGSRGLSTSSVAPWYDPFDRERPAGHCSRSIHPVLPFQTNRGNSHDTVRNHQPDRPQGQGSSGALPALPQGRRALLVRVNFIFYLINSLWL